MDVGRGAPTYAGWRAGGLLALLIALNVLNFVDRILPQAFIVDIMRDLKLTYTQFTLITGPLFGLVYAAVGLFVGIMADRYSRPRIIAAGLIIWSGFTATTGLPTTFPQIAASRALVAIGEASLSPTALAMISSVFSDAKRGFVSSLYYIGISAGAGLAYIIAGSLGATIGWRQCFVVLGLVGACLAVVVMLLPDAPRQAAPSSSSMGKAWGETWLTLRQSSSLRWLLLGVTLATFGQNASVLDQAWLVNERGYETAQAQSQFGLLFLAGSLIGAIVGGLIADMFNAWFKAGRVVYVICVFALIGPALFALRFAAADSAMFLGLFVLVSAGFTLAYGGIIPAIQDLAPATQRACVIAVALLSMALLGAALGNFFAGVMADVYGRMGVEAPLTAALMTTNAATLIALLPLILAVRSFSSDRARYAAVQGT